jgi:threonine/homoserine/homoserine lactone efflux protein
MSKFLKGLLLGLTLQLAIGPVFFFIVNISLQKTISDGFAGVLGVTLGDYTYILLSILGIGKLLENKRTRKVFGIISSIVLIIFGLMLLKNVSTFHVLNTNITETTNIISSFFSVYFLTISSPLTIVLFTSIFTAKAVEYNLTKRQLLLFGLGTGFATFLFMAASVILFSIIKMSVPEIIIQLLNSLVGCLLIGYGVLRLLKIRR